MTLSRHEEMLYREIQAMAGDLNQTAENITRDHDERLKQSQERNPPEPGVIMPMRGFNSSALARDLVFIRDRISLLLDFAAPLLDHPPSGIGRTTL